MNKRGQESKDLWIQARIDELMDNDEWHWQFSFNKKNAQLKKYATEQATREYAEIEAMILNAQIDNLELK